MAHLGYTFAPATSNHIRCFQTSQPSSSCTITRLNHCAFPPASTFTQLVSISPSAQLLSWTNITLHSRDLHQRARTKIQAAWTRRSSNQPKKTRKSWGQRVDKYMRPFMLDINLSRKYISAKVMHRVTSKVVSVVSTNSKDLRESLPLLNDSNACRVVGKLLAERAKAADVFAVTYEPRKNEKLEGKLALILDTILENGITLV